MFSLPRKRSPDWGISIGFLYPCLLHLQGDREMPGLRKDRQDLAPFLSCPELFDRSRSSSRSGTRPMPTTIAPHVRGGSQHSVADHGGLCPPLIAQRTPDDGEPMLRIG